MYNNTIIQKKYIQIYKKSIKFDIFYKHIEEILIQSKLINKKVNYLFRIFDSKESPEEIIKQISDFCERKNYNKIKIPALKLIENNDYHKKLEEFQLGCMVIEYRDDEELWVLDDNIKKVNFGLAKKKY